MNKITKKSFYSFLALYLGSSFIFLALAAYWFFTSQVSMEMNNNFYRMTKIADDISAQIIKADMNHQPFKLQASPNASIALLDKDRQLLEGGVSRSINFEKDFYMKDAAFTLISQKSSGHLGIAYIVVQSSQCNQNVAALKNRVSYVSIFTAVFIILIAVFLSYMFLKPLRDKMQEMEEFVKDTTHELNTPITALMMSTSRLKSKKNYDKKINKNISISTKQLYDIYASLSYLSFDHKSEEPQEIDFSHTLKNSIEYFSELLEKKNISLESDIKSCIITIAPSKAKMLINNLLSNAIKYSTPNTKITVTLTRESFTIQDQGIGIEKEKLQEIFKRFVRANSYAGGFGVGLNIVESIIKEYNYKIEIDSTPNIGTTVRILFSDIS